MSPPWDSTVKLKAALDAATAPKCDHTAVLIGVTPGGQRIYWCAGCGSIRPSGNIEWIKPQRSKGNSK